MSLVQRIQRAPHLGFAAPASITGSSITHAQAIEHHVIDWPTDSWSRRPSLLRGALDRLRLGDRERLERALVSIGSEGTPVFLDLETTSTHSEVLPFVVGVAWYAHDRTLRVEQWSLHALPAEPTFMRRVAEALANILGRRGTLVTFNGASFDLPRLRRRFVRYGVATDSLRGSHVDLLPLARRLWRRSLPDCRLLTLERARLGVHRIADVSAQEIMASFWRLLENPQHLAARGQFEAVLEHNRADLLTLPALLAAVEEALWRPSNPETAIGAARHWMVAGHRDRAMACLEPWLPLRGRSPGQAFGGMRGAFREAALLGARLAARSGSRDRAAWLWAWVCQQFPGDPEAHEALAKHLEHVVVMPEEALRVARRSGCPCPRRLARLIRKVAPQRV